jgi:hypothetical protein
MMWSIDGHVIFVTQAGQQSGDFVMLWHHVNRTVSNGTENRFILTGRYVNCGDNPGRTLVNRRTSTKEFA